MKTTIITIAAVLVASSNVMGQEIRATHELVSRALQQQQQEDPQEKINPEEYEYHFRKIGDRVLFCAYSIGGNGGFCTKNGPGYVAQIDQGTRKFCKENPNADPPHAIYGEAYDLQYACKGSRMTRLPYSFGFDEEGYVRKQWQVLN